MRKKSILLWEERYRRWKQGKSTRIEPLTGEKYIKEMETVFHRKGVLKPSMLLSHPLVMKLGTKIYRASPGAYFGAMYPILQPRYLFYLSKEAELSKEPRRIRACLNSHDIKIPSRSKGISGIKVSKKLKNMFETGNLDISYYYITRRFAHKIYTPEIIEVMVKDIGGKPTAFMLKKFRYAERR